MNSSSEFQESMASEHGLPPTAPETPTRGLPERPPVADATLRAAAEALSRGWEMLEPATAEVDLQQRLVRLESRLKEALRVCALEARTGKPTPQLELLESTRMLEAALPKGSEAAATFADLPLVRVGEGESLPRVINLAEMYLATAQGIWSPESLTVFVREAQRRDPLLLNEVAVLPGALKMGQLEFILDRVDEAFAAGAMPPIERSPFSASLHSLRRLGQAEWPKVLEPMVAFDSILREDPSGAYPLMEDESRNAYRVRVAHLARNADLNEVETARAALELARAASRTGDADPRRARRTMHIGYYLFAEGLAPLGQRIGYYAPPIDRLRRFVRRWNEEFYILGNFSLSLLLIVAVIAPLVPHHAIWPVVGALLLALLPATQGAVDLVNGSVAALFKAESLPKLDFSKGVPDGEAAVVAVPTLLLSEKQVGELFDDLEARYLSNQDPNLHYLLLTDLPDTKTRPVGEDQNALVQMAVHRTEALNAKYAKEAGGSFLLLHRHRIFNARQGVWMGWERKRGKLLDLNNLLLGGHDSFPVKAGPTGALARVRYVITLDSDTQLPRGAAARMVGTMAHPLNQAIIHPRTRVVTAGYGILQPRVGVSVSSASQSRLAALYSGETGFDIYTRAVSDVYQDLFGEGIFAGKGIYEVSVLHQVLDRRFPRNALLSHDLIEGSYARAGLVTDIEVIDDYPSHYSAHTRRKHRWVRGDWQIAQWIFNRVPDESGRMVENPINTISRWKIFDNLRRSLVEPVTFLMLVLGWFVLPGGPLYWTLATILLLLLPVLFQFAFTLGRALVRLSVAAMRDSLSTLSLSMGFTLLNLTFLPHQMLLSLDAIVRSLSRRFFSGKHLLEWETAAEAETGKRQTPVDRYMRYSPAVVAAIGLVMALTKPRALPAAVPVLVLWAVAPLVVRWLNAAPRREEGPLAAADRALLEEQALRIWRYFHDFGGAANHWLIPDNVEEKDTLQVRKLSPTNLGMLLNARQAAYQLGFLTLPEFAEASLGTLGTYERLKKYRGHIYNWYDIESLQAVAPFTVSTVDSGNLAAGLYTLHAGTLDLLARPVLKAGMFRPAERMRGGTGSDGAARVGAGIGAGAGSMRAVVQAGIADLFARHGGASLPSQAQAIDGDRGDGWIAAEGARREQALMAFVEGYVPWLLPRFVGLVPLAEEALPALEDSAAFAAGLGRTLEGMLVAGRMEPAAAGLVRELQTALVDARARLAQLTSDMAQIAIEAERHADAIEYGFLLVQSRQLLSIGYDGATGEVHSACYDLLASEARIATFLAIAKGDIPQGAWFKLDRTHVLVRGRAALLSWTGTMFEYMMPMLWMRHMTDTLIGRSLEAAARIQRDAVRGIPWGISESGFAKMDEGGRYGYQAWGIPALALKYGAEDGPVVSPYSTFLAMPLLRRDAIANLRRMIGLGWTGAYGLYEAADYSRGGQPELVRSWMAHHQGMSLLAVTNLLHGNVFQRWFHANARVRAAELLLHEKPLTKETLKSLERQPLREVAKGEEA
jgi:cyclic beta-1,2-glucan synthetase